MGRRTGEWGGGVETHVPVMATGECAGVTVAKKRTKGKEKRKEKSGHNREREGKREKGVGGGGGEERKAN